MRRPVKPFVTEYKSTPRRPKDVFDVPSGPDSVQETAPFGFGEGSRNVPPPEDGYDAAMRAADALFAPPTAPRAEPPVADHRTVGSNDVARSPERNGGRILEAIDVTPVDPFAALEAERAPKRRGRKPGSKNKPKAAPVAALGAGDGHGAEPVYLDVRQPDLAAEPRAKRPSMPETKRVAILAAEPARAERRTGERFAWVRTTLRPGERWKRRLPKVAW